MRIYKRDNSTGRVAQFLGRSRIARINQAFAQKGDTICDGNWHHDFRSECISRDYLTCHPQTVRQLLRRESLKPHVSAHFDLITIESRFDWFLRSDWNRQIYCFIFIICYIKCYMKNFFHTFFNLKILWQIPDWFFLSDNLKL